MTSTPQRSDNQGRYKCVEYSAAGVGKHPRCGANKTDPAASEVRPKLSPGAGGRQEVAAVQAAIAEAKTTNYVNQETDRDPTYECCGRISSRRKVTWQLIRQAWPPPGAASQRCRAEMVQLGNQSLQVADLQREAQSERAELSTVSVEAASRNALRMHSTKRESRTLLSPYRLRCLCCRYTVRYTRWRWPLFSL